MANRLIRDDLLTSERVQTLPFEGRWLYLAILLTADDVGLFEVNPFRLAREAAVDFKTIPGLIQALADVDLIRLYEVAGKRYGFTPRFRQRLQIKRAKHPLPPLALLAGDEDAVSKINNLALNPRLNTVSHRGTPSEPEPEEENKRKRHSAKSAGSTGGRTVSLAQIVASGVDKQSAESWLVARRAKRLPLTPAAWQQTLSEAQKAGLTIAEAIKTAAGEGWAGFKAAWMVSIGQQRGVVPTTVPAKESAAAYLARLAAEAEAKQQTPEQAAASEAAREEAMARLGRGRKV